MAAFKSEIDGRIADETALATIVKEFETEHASIQYMAYLYSGRILIYPHNPAFKYVSIFIKLHDPFPPASLNGLRSWLRNFADKDTLANCDAIFTNVVPEEAPSDS